MGQIYSASVFYRSVSAATGLGVPIFNLKAGSNAVRLREVVLGTALGSTTVLQGNAIRFVRAATTYATEGGTSAFTVEPHMPWSRASQLTPAQGSATLLGRIVAGVTAAEAATEGGKLLYSDTITGISTTGSGARWSWNSWGSPERSYWVDNLTNLSIHLHATDTTIINATVVFEEMTRNT